MRRDVLLPLLVFVVQIPLTVAYLTGLIPVHPIVIMLPLVGLLNGHIDRRGLQGLGLTVLRPARSLLLALAFSLLGFIGRLIVLRLEHVSLHLPPLTGATVGSLAKDFAVDLFIIALWEEIVNRGYIQTRLQATWGFSGVVGATLLFASLHVPSALHNGGGGPRVLYRFMQTGLAGLVLGTLYWWTGSVWPPIALHGLRNFTMITLAHHLSGLTATQMELRQIPFQLLWLMGQAALMPFACQAVLGHRRLET
jgi:membrane protease YdiL (CAAX protease family)